MPISDRRLFALSGPEFLVYAQRALFKLTLFPHVMARLRTGDIDAIISRRRGREADLQASTASTTHDLAVGILISAATDEEADSLMRTILSSLRFVETGWRSDDELRSHIDAALAKWPLTIER